MIYISSLQVGPVSVYLELVYERCGFSSEGENYW